MLEGDAGCAQNAAKDTKINHQVRRAQQDPYEKMRSGYFAVSMLIERKRRLLIGILATKAGQRQKTNVQWEQGEAEISCLVSSPSLYLMCCVSFLLFSLLLPATPKTERMVT